jgi:urease accessory protein
MEAAGLQGHLHLVCALDSRGVSHLRSQSFRAPMHISKPHLDGETLVVNIVNPTAGLLAGDEIKCDVAVERGARLVLTTPSAARSHRMRDGRAVLVQELRVASGGFLDVWPELFIPQAGTRYHQRTSARVERGGTLLLSEMLAPGRVASGEAFAYDWLRWETDLFVGHEHVARERYKLQPGTPSVEALRGMFEHAYYASVYVIAETLSETHECWRAIHDLHSERAWVGMSRLRGGGWVIKVLASESIALRGVMARIRTLVYAALGQAMPDLRRTGVLEISRIHHGSEGFVAGAEATI